MKKYILNTKFLNPFILVLLGAGLLRMTWLKWANIAVDYGRELYTPWRITCGQVLYKDIASLFGPFPPYWNALLFKIFGVSIMTLVLFNILLVIGITVLIYRFFSYTADRRIALFASTAFLSIFAFQQSNLGWDQGNFNYICPYSYSVTYAAFFSLWAINLFAAHGRSGRDAWLGAVGILIGLTALCRFEIFIFFAIAVALGFISRGFIGHWPLGRFLKAGALLLGGFCAPIGIAYLYFSTQLPGPQVWPSIFGFNYRWLEILKANYYQFMTGLGHPWHNFIIMLTTAACYGVVVIAFKCLCMGVDLFKKIGERWKGIIFVLLGLAGMARVVVWILCFPYDQIFKGLPVVVILMVGYLSLLLVQHQQDGQKIRQVLPLWVMAVWSLLMLTKVLLNVQINSEGFVYAMPGVILFVVLFLGAVPQYFERVYPRAYFVRPLASALMAFIFIARLGSIANVYQSRNFLIRSGPDIIICRGNNLDHRFPGIGEIDTFLKDVDNIMGKDANFAAFPQGIMLNFLTKRTTPLPHIVFMEAEIAVFGEEEMLRSFKEHKPDYVVLSNQMPFNYYHHKSGAKYAHTIRAWILANYHPVWHAHPEIGNMLTVYKRSVFIPDAQRISK
jgi:hypothetical protein